MMHPEYLENEFTTKVSLVLKSSCQCDYDKNTGDNLYKFTKDGDKIVVPKMNVVLYINKTLPEAIKEFDLSEISKITLEPVKIYSIH